MNDLEIYHIHENPVSVKFGRFKENVFNKHVASYGMAAANKMLEKAIHILSAALKQKENQLMNNNVLLVGKIQSGKTSNLEILSALAFDSGFRLLIIYGGYDSDLLNQSFERFKATFRSTDPESDPIILTVNDGLEALDEEYIEEMASQDRPIIVEVMKRPPQLIKLNNALKKLEKLNIPAFIIDDEGDQASLNTNYKNQSAESKSKASATYKEIVTMKSYLKNHIYFSVTATPQANIFQPSLSALKPQSLFLFEPGEGYHGCDVFHLNEDKIINVPDSDPEMLIDSNKLTDSLKDAIRHFICASTIMMLRGIKKSDMIIHSVREVDLHDEIYKKIDGYLTTMKENILTDDMRNFVLDNIKSVYNAKFFDKQVLDEYPWDENFVNTLIKVLRTIHIVVKNASNNKSNNIINTYTHVIYIGGDLLQRGITFKHLVTTYFTRWAKSSGNMDTSLQRARWFGYRKNFIDLCRVFLTKQISNEFGYLATIENDLWDQFNMVMNKELDINDIIIDANDSSLNPTRKNVANIETIKFSTKWNNQRVVTFDLNQIKNNNEKFESLMSNRDFKTTTRGRTDGKISAYYTYISGNDFINFVNDTFVIFENSPFLKNDISKHFKDKEICVQIMFGGELQEYRSRSFYKNKVSALQQGADTVDKSRRKYLGDAAVIADDNAICLQVFLVVPKIDDHPETLDMEKKQYMYSVHFNKPRKAYIGG